MQLQEKNWGLTPLGTRLVFRQEDPDAAWETLKKLTPGEMADTLTARNPGLGYAVSLGEIGSAYLVTPSYLFKTRRGTMGVVQFSGFTNNAPGVKIRYRLVDGSSPAPAIPRIPVRRPRFSSFGPVVECVLNDPDADVHNSFLDLDSGKVSDCPIDWPLHGATNANSFEMGIRVGLAMGAADTLLRLVREKGLDLQGDASGGSVTAFDMVAEPVANEEFDDTSAIDILQRRSHEPPEDRVTLHATNTPATWFFRTREGGVGVLQITGFTTNAPHAAKIRYKLVRSSASASAPQLDAAHRSAGRRPATSPTAGRHYSPLVIGPTTGRHRA